MSLIDGRMQDAFLHTAIGRSSSILALLFVVHAAYVCLLPEEVIITSFHEYNFIGR